MTFLVFDVESTGIDVFNDRIVQLVIALADAEGEITAYQEWLIDPGVDVPDEAAKVHGFSTEFLQIAGDEPHKALWEAEQMFAQGVRDDRIFVAFNANYDLSILTAEMARHGLTSRYGHWIADNARILDPLVVDRAKVKKRRGKRRLIELAQHYGIVLDEGKLHNALYDVEVTARLAAQTVGKYGIPTNAEQAQWHREWATDFEKFLRKAQEDDTVVIEKEWPVREKEEE